MSSTSSRVRAGLCLFVGVILALFMGLPILDSAGDTQFAELGVWHARIGLLDNAYFSWRIDPWVLFLAGYLARTGPSDLIGVHASIFFIGVFTLLKSSSQSDSGITCLASLLALIIISVFFGGSSVVWGVLVWLPWTIWAATLALQTAGGPSLGYFLLLVLFATRLSHAANQLAILVTPFAVFAAFKIAAGKRSPYSAFEPIFFVALFFPALVTTFSASLPEFPSYPSFGHLVPDDGLPGFIRPLVGPGFPLPVIDHAAIVGQYGPLALLTLISSIGFLITKQGAPAARRLFAALSLPLILMVLADTVLPESLSLISPLASIARVVPHTFFFSLSPIALSLGVFGLFIALSMSRSLLLISLTTLILLVPIEGSPALRTLNKTMAVDSLGLNLWNSFDKQVLLSPSWKMIKDTNGTILLRQSEIQNPGPALDVNQIAFIRASKNGSARSLRKLIDGTLSNRWTPGQGRQQGNEWLMVELTGEVKLSGIELPTGKFSSDFPRGLRISYIDAQCPEEAEGDRKFSRNFRVVYQDSAWQGPINFAPGGYPFFGGQNDVRVTFPKDIIARCLLIQQTGSDSNFDWSISELRLISAK